MEEGVRSQGAICENAEAQCFLCSRLVPVSVFFGDTSCLSVQLREEFWVGCDSCSQWVHQVCALYNGRNDQGTSTHPSLSPPLSYLDATGTFLFA
jgi:hypothetical protein